ncbi:MAG: SDR family oxidoreductase [Gammaproteobacteria bacterium]|nr:SDR family oxidoreductase [Gammaproteobacteria bacterium]
MEPHPVAIITGASQGIGKACAIGISQAGYRPVLVARTESKLRAVANEIEARLTTGEIQKPIVYPLDVTDYAKVQQFVAEIDNQFGRVDLLVNNAGILRRGTLDVSVSDFEQIIKTNLVSPFVLLKELVPLMKKRGKGHIFNIASRGGKTGFAGEGAYDASKFGIVGLSESLYRELAREGISVTAICPGWVNTEMAQQGGATLSGEEMIQPEDILKTIQWVLELAPNTCVREVVIEPTRSIV